MHILLRCPEGRRFEDLAPPRSIEGDAARARLTSVTVPFALHVQQNRSSFPPSGRLPLLAMLALSFAATIAPAMRGYYLVPAAVLVGMASLLLALEIFQRQPVPSETIEIDFDQPPATGRGSRNYAKVRMAFASCCIAAGKASRTAAVSIVRSAPVSRR